MIQIYKKFLDKNLINDVINYVKENQDNYVWRVNQLAWDESIVNKGKEVSILNLEKFTNRFLKIYKEKKVINKDLKICGILFYIWGRGSFIPFHNDAHVEAASTIYLNDSWDSDDGGLFIWRDELNKLNVVEPEFNKMVFNSNKLWHGVTMIAPFSQQLRYSVQVFFKKN